MRDNSVHVNSGISSWTKWALIILCFHHRVKNLLEKRRHLYTWYGKMHWWQWHSCRRPPSFYCYHLCTGWHLSPHSFGDSKLNFFFFVTCHTGLGLWMVIIDWDSCKSRTGELLLSHYGRRRRRRRTGKHWVSSLCGFQFQTKNCSLVIFLQKKP